MRPALLSSLVLLIAGAPLQQTEGALQTRSNSISDLLKTRGWSLHDILSRRANFANRRFSSTPSCSDLLTCVKNSEENCLRTTGTGYSFCTCIRAAVPVCKEKFGLTGTQVTEICSGSSNLAIANDFKVSSPAVYGCIESVFFPSLRLNERSTTSDDSDAVVASKPTTCPQDVAVCATYARSTCGSDDPCCLAEIWSKCLENYSDKTVINWGCRFGYEDLNQASLTCASGTSTECFETDKCVSAGIKECGTDCLCLNQYAKQCSDIDAGKSIAAGQTTCSSLKNITTRLGTCVNNLGGCFQAYKNKINDACGATFNLDHTVNTSYTFTATQLSQICSDSCGSILSDETVLSQTCPGSMFVPSAADEILSAVKLISKIRNNVLCTKSSDGQYCPLATESIVSSAVSVLGDTFDNLVSGKIVSLTSAQKEFLETTCSDPCWLNLATAAARSGASVSNIQSSDVIADNVAKFTDGAKLALFCMKQQTTKEDDSNFCVEPFSRFSNSVGIFSNKGKRYLSSNALKKLVCNSNCVPRVAAVLRPILGSDAVPALDPALCFYDDVLTNQTCIDLLANLGDIPGRCFDQVQEVISDKGTISSCSDLPSACSDMIVELKSFGCCANTLFNSVAYSSVANVIAQLAPVCQDYKFPESKCQADTSGYDGNKTLVIVLPNLAYEWVTSNLDTFVSKVTLDLAVSFGIPTSYFSLSWTRLHSNGVGTVAGFTVIYKSGSNVEAVLKSVAEDTSSGVVITTNNVATLPNSAYVNTAAALEVTSVSAQLPSSEGGSTVSSSGSDGSGNDGNGGSGGSTTSSAAGRVQISYGAAVVAGVVALLMA